MPDLRTEKQKKLDSVFGMPLYYCAECLRGVSVKSVGNDVVVRRPCVECSDSAILAPRKAIAVGKGGASIGTKQKILASKIMALITKRSGVSGGV